MTKLPEIKYKIRDLETYEVSIRHADDLKEKSMKVNLTHETHDEDEPAQADATHTDSVRKNEDIIDDNNDMQEYRKKPRGHTQRQSESNDVLLVCNITEFFLENEFDNYVKLLIELRVDVSSFYR